VCWQRLGGVFHVHCKFQQDGARAHTSKATIAWLDANIKHCILQEDWPPDSLDLSPIENKHE